MAFRFSKRIRLIPGVRLNVSKSGMSLSAGIRGATINVSSRGARATVGIPGTGMSWSHQVAKPNGKEAAQPRKAASLTGEHAPKALSPRPESMRSDLDWIAEAARSGRSSLSLFDELVTINDLLSRIAVELNAISPQVNATTRGWTPQVIVDESARNPKGRLVRLETALRTVLQGYDEAWETLMLLSEQLAVLETRLRQIRPGWFSGLNGKLHKDLNELAAEYRNGVRSLEEVIENLRLEVQKEFEEARSSLKESSKPQT